MLGCPVGYMDITEGSRAMLRCPVGSMYQTRHPSLALEPSVRPCTQLHLSVDVGGRAVHEKNRKNPRYPIGPVPLASSGVLTYVFNCFCQSRQKKVEAIGQKLQF
jgi:hypothetical protein